MRARIFSWAARVSTRGAAQAPHRTAKLRGPGAGLAAFVTTLGLGLAGAPAAVAQDLPSEPLVDVIVRLTPDASVRAAVREQRDQGSDVIATFRQTIDGFAARVDTDTLRALRSDPSVLAIEPDRRVRAFGAPWGLDRIDQRALPLSGGFSSPGSGAGVTAYVVDTGILSTHAQFGGRVRAGYSAIEDGLGTEDCNGHGTHVAGTVGGATVGVAPAASLVPVRVLPCDGRGWMSDVIAGVEWIVADHAAGVPAVANLSLGGTASSSVDAAVAALVSDGVSVVVSAGNSAVDACTQSPARAGTALTIGATDSTDGVATFSNQGSCLDLFAPGVSIVSASPSSSSGMAYMSGTSMAAPHVAGAAAVMLGLQPGLAPADITAHLTGGATTGVISGLKTGSPDRLLHVAAGLPATAPLPAPTMDAPAPVAPVTSPAPAPAPAPAATAPAAPHLQSVRVAGTSATLIWSQTGDGRSPLTGQTVTTHRDGAVVAAETVAAESTTWEVLGLESGRRYTFTVSATNAVGTSPDSAAAEVVVPAMRPAAPERLKVRAKHRRAIVRWRLGDDGGAEVRTHVVKVYVTGRAKPIRSVTAKADVHRVVLRKLPTNARLRFVVRAVNEIGRGTPTRSGRIHL